MRTWTFAAAFLAFSIHTYGQELYINEILASNSNVNLDDFDETDDWIEIYNAGTVPADLAGYYISDDPEDLTKYQIPVDQPVFVTQGDFKLIWTDNDNEQGPDHTSFALSADGEWAILTDPDGTTIIDQVQFPAQQTDISYGRASDADADWIFFNEPTPEATNQESTQDAQQLYINEVLTDNQNNIDDQANEHEPWFEIYNPNPFQVNLAGYFISNTDDPQLFQIPSFDPTLTTVEANDFLIIWADGDVDQGSNHAGFELPNSAGTLTLYGPDGSIFVDDYEFPELDTDISFGRTSDGALSSEEFDIPTPRVTNTLVIIEPENIYINEVLTDNSAGITDNAGELEDWFELYNPNPYPVNLAGYYLSDDEYNPTKFQIALGNTDSTTIQPGDWMLFYADEDQSQGVNHVNFRLNNQGEQVILYGPDGFTSADAIEFGFFEENLSLGRETDGGPNWVLFSGTTPDASNEDGSVSIEEPESDELQFGIFPNPAVSGKINFQRTEKEVRLYNTAGALIKTIVNQSSMSVDQLEPGVYLLKNDSGKVARLVVQ